MYSTVGMLIALARIDEIVEVVRRTSETSIVKEILTSDKFGFSTLQCDAILSMKLGRLTTLEENILKNEQTKLIDDMSVCKNVLEQDYMVFDVIKSETKALKQKYGKPRQSEIMHDDGGILSEQDLIENDR